MSHNGIPKNLTLESARKWAEPRVSHKRFRHVEGVAFIGKKLAKRVERCDPFLAELACWLHDACKEEKDRNLVAMAKEFGMELDAIEEANGHLLHGPVAALVIKRDLGITNQELLDAIAEHTLGKVGMSELSQVVFLADCLEEGRPKDFTQPIWNALEKKDKSANLDAAMLVACDLSLKGLIDSNKVIHPRTVQVRNYFLARNIAKEKS